MNSSTLSSRYSYFYSYFLCVLTLVSASTHAVSHLNLFNPYDIMLHPPIMPADTHCLSVAYEFLVGQQGFQDDRAGDDRSFRRRCDILQLWQDEQDGLAAFKSALPDSTRGQVANLFSRDDDAGNQALFLPTGKIAAHNFMLSYLYQWSQTTSVALYLPIINLALKDVRFRERTNTNFFESTFTNPNSNSATNNGFVQLLEEKGDIAIRSSSRTGVGDFTALIWWERGFPQVRPLLRNVTLRVRGGFTFPTGLKNNNDIFFSLPFGYDASWGILGGATIEFRYAPCVGLGIDVELLNLFGTVRNRRVKSNPAQTDLLLLAKTPSFVDPGFIQHYTIWGSWFLAQFCTFRVAYQYFRQQDSHIFIGSDTVDIEIANTAEFLQEWTTHDFLFQLYYEVPRPAGSRVYPRLGIWYKYGFNGKRAIAADTVGFSCDIAF